MVNQTTRYALHIMSHLARNDGALVSGETVAREIGVPANYLSKILNQLRKSGFVEARKGWGGGFRIKHDSLARPLEELVQVFEGETPSGLPVCIFGLPECDSENPCPLHTQWAGIRDSFTEMLRTMTVGDLRDELFDAAARRRSDRIGGNRSG